MTEEELNKEWDEVSKEIEELEIRLKELRRKSEALTIIRFNKQFRFKVRDKTLYDRRLLDVY